MLGLKLVGLYLMNPSSIKLPTHWAGRVTRRSCSRRCPMAKIVRAVPSAVLPDLLTVEQMADILGLAQNTVRSLCRSGELPAVHIGRRWYVPRAKLNEFLGVA